MGSRARSERRPRLIGIHTEYAYSVCTRQGRELKSNAARPLCPPHGWSGGGWRATLVDMTASQIQPDLTAARERWVARGVAAPAIVATGASGSSVEGADGVRYLDFAGGIGCQNLGHSPSAVVDAIH